jgi:hypothetical protein
MEAVQENMETKVDTTMSIGQEVKKAYQEKMVAIREIWAEIKAGQEEVKVGVEEMKATVRASQEKMETAANSIHSELEETIKNQVEDGLASVNQWTQDLCRN